ncbi:MAG: ribonuclease P protein component [bacterium]|nr:ribonuclease P protein component [bacterium]
MPKEERLQRNFPKQFRLTRQGEISRIFADGEFFRAGYLKFKWTPAESGYLKVVISISKRAGNSPMRNRLKRLIREVLRHRPELERTPIHLAVFVTSPTRQPPQLREIQTYLERFFANLR